MEARKTLATLARGRRQGTETLREGAHEGSGSDCGDRRSAKKKRRDLLLNMGARQNGRTGGHKDNSEECRVFSNRTQSGPYVH